VLLPPLVVLVLLLPAGAARGLPEAHSASVCPAAADVRKGVYHPQRLIVLSACQRAAGTVVAWHREHPGDGDLHIQLKLDPAYSSLKNAKNDSDQGGNLVVEFMPRDGGHLPRPVVGQHLLLKGAWVLDTKHGWREIHPVWSVTVNGHTYRSGPQNGGSPPTDNSTNSEADCVDHGHPCTGY
jgi:hypothetical protein